MNIEKFIVYCTLKGIHVSQTETFIGNLDREKSWRVTFRTDNVHAAIIYTKDNKIHNTTIKYIDEDNVLLETGESWDFIKEKILADESR